jgi:hypothetical protein
VAGLFIPILWFGMDFQGAAGTEQSLPSSAPAIPREPRRRALQRAGRATAGNAKQRGSRLSAGHRATDLKVPFFGPRRRGKRHINSSLRHAPPGSGGN